MLFMKEPFQDDPFWKAWDREKPDTDGQYLFLSHGGEVMLASYRTEHKCFYTTEAVLMDGVNAPAGLGTPIAWARIPRWPVFVRNVTGTCGQCRHRLPMSELQRPLVLSSMYDSECGISPIIRTAPFKMFHRAVHWGNTCKNGKFEPIVAEARPGE